MLIEEDHKCLLIIGGIQILLPNIQVEARECFADVTTKGQPIVIVIEEEKQKEHILMSSPTKEKEHAIDFITPWEKELEMMED
jgi:hypothetical protein